MNPPPLRSLIAATQLIPATVASKPIDRISAKSTRAAPPRPAGGRRSALNSFEPDWPQTLTGFAKRAHEFWQKELQPKGYKVRAQIMDVPGGVPGDVGIFLGILGPDAIGRRLRIDPRVERCRNPRGAAELHRMIMWLPVTSLRRQHFEPAFVYRFVDGLPLVELDLPEPTASTDELG